MTTAHDAFGAGGRWGDLPARRVVAIALAQLERQGSAVAGLVGHTARARDVEALLCDPPWPRQDQPDADAPECVGVTVHDTGFFFAAHPAPDRSIGDSPGVRLAPALARSPVAGQGTGLVHLADLTAPCVPRSVYGGLAHDEYLLSVAVGGGASEVADFAGLAALAAGMAATGETPLWFMHGPAAPPGRRGDLRAPSGPVLRWAVSMPSTQARTRIEFGHRLVAKCADRPSYGMWLPQRFGGSRDYDLWQEVLTPMAVQRTLDVRPRARRALTVVGPARYGLTSRVVEWVSGASADDPSTHRDAILGVYLTSFADLAIVNLALAVDPSDPTLGSASAGEETAEQTLRRLYPGVPKAAGRPLDDCRAFVNDLPGPYAPDVTDRGALWISWRTPGRRTALATLIAGVRLAVDRALASWDDLDLRIDYLISRRSARGALVGRAKLSLLKEPLLAAARRLTVTHDGNGGGAVSWSLAADTIERAWREHALAAFDTPWVDVRVVWRESWISSSSDLHGGVDYS
jgi:hypothetical protein